MKYILFEDFSGDPVPILFPNRIDFEQIREHIPYPKVLAAGYVELRKGKFACHGESTMLGVGSRPQDAQVLDEKFSPGA